MMLNRRSFLIAGAATLLVPRRPFADSNVATDGCVDTEHRLSFKGFKHCELHPFYQIVFPQWGCHCGAGECRPSTHRIVPSTAENPEGVVVMVAGQMWPVPEGRLRRNRDIPEPLFGWSAHVCCTIEPSGKEGPTITCAW